MKRRFFPIILVCLLLCGSFFSCSSGKQNGIIEQTENNAVPVSWIAETEDVRKELEDRYWELYDATKEMVPVKTSGTVYYVSSVNGSNTNNGKSKSAPLKSCVMLENLSLKSGDAVLFECGSVFREQVSLVSGVTYSCYGSGKKPIFLGSVNASGSSKWIAVSGKKNLYYYNGTINYQGRDIGNICFDNGKAWGIKIQKLESGNATLELKNVSNGLTVFEKIPSYAFSDGKDLKDYNLTYYHDPSGRLYLYCEGGNPGDVFQSIELSQSVNIFNGSDGISNVTVANLDFRCSGRFAIRTLNAENLTVKNCRFSFIGGSIQFDYENSARDYKTRYGNAIENWNGVNGMTVENCYFDQIYDAAVTTQSNSKVEMKNIVYRGNVIENAWYGIELWSGGSDATGNVWENVEISNNYFSKIGSGMTTQRPDKTEKNIGLECFLKISRGTYRIINASVTKNIIEGDGSVGKLFDCIQPKTDGNENGFLFDENTYVSRIGAGFGTLPASFPQYSGIYNTSEKLISFEFGTLRDLASHGFETNGRFIYSAGEDSASALKCICSAFESRLNTLPLYTYTAANGTVLPFRLILPDGYSDKNEYPMIVYLNSEYASGNDNLKQTAVSNTLMAKIADNGEYILLVPQCPEKVWTGISTESGNYAISGNAESAVMCAVADLLNDVAVKYHASEKYAIGVDSGACAVADLIARHRNLIAKAVILSGAGDPSASIGKTEVWVIHAEFDEKVAFENAQELANAWGAKLTAYPRGNLHDCWNKAFEKEEILSWLQE